MIIDNASEGISAIPVAQAQPADVGDLRLRVQTGERFPMIKTAEQQLLQTSSSDSGTAITQLQLSLILLVEDVTDDYVVFNVRYTRVYYAHTVDGHRNTYDSTSSIGLIPHDAVPYTGLVDNGDSVRIGISSQVEERIGHHLFLQRCVSKVPHERWKTLMNEVAVRFVDEGIAGLHS